MTGLAPSLTERQVTTPIKGESVAGKADGRTKRREKAAAIVALVKALGGASAVAAQIDSSRSAVTNWYTSGIPAKFWLPLAELATARRVDPDVARMALPRVAAERAQQWDPAPRLAAVIQAVETATTLPDLMSCLIELDRLNDPDPTRAPYPIEEDNDWTDRWVLAEAKVLERIAGLRPETADQAQTLFKLMAARIEDDVIERANVNQYIWSALMTAHECLRVPTASASDADLIEICDEYVRTLRTIRADKSDNDMAGHLWQAYDQLSKAIDAAKPGSVAGMLAKARVAKFEAIQPNGHEDPAASNAADWSWDLVNDLLRLFGKAADPSNTDDIDALAATDFQPWPQDKMAVLGTSEAWMSRIAQHAATIDQGVSFLRLDRDELRNVCLGSEQEITDFQKDVQDLRQRFLAYAEVLDTISARLICGVAWAGTDKGRTAVKGSGKMPEDLAGEAALAGRPVALDRMGCAELSRLLPAMWAAYDKVCDRPAEVAIDGCYDRIEAIEQLILATPPVTADDGFAVLTIALGNLEVEKGEIQDVNVREAISKIHFKAKMALIAIAKAGVFDAKRICGDNYSPGARL